MSHLQWPTMSVAGSEACEQGSCASVEHDVPFKRSVANALSSCERDELAPTCRRGAVSAKLQHRARSFGKQKGRKPSAAIAGGCQAGSQSSAPASRMIVTPCVICGVWAACQPRRLVHVFYDGDVAL